MRRNDYACLREVRQRCHLLRRRSKTPPTPSLLLLLFAIIILLIIIIVVIMIMIMNMARPTSTAAFGESRIREDAELRRAPTVPRLVLLLVTGPGRSKNALQRLFELSEVRNAARRAGALL